jgi:hypothetical protein
VRDALAVLGSTLENFRGAYGLRDEVDPIKHLIGTAIGWGGNPDKDAIYEGVTPTHNDGKTAYQLTVRNVPVDAFWSISVYNEKGYFEPNPRNAYSINNLTAAKNADGSVTIHFGACDDETTNCLPITPGWNYTVRMYCPRKDIRDGSWKFPHAEPVKE